MAVPNIVFNILCTTSNNINPTKKPRMKATQLPSSMASGAISKLNKPSVRPAQTL